VKVIFIRCNSCGSFRNENGEDVALRASILEKEVIRLRQVLARIKNSSSPHEEPVSRAIAITALEAENQWVQDKD
jgi:hypothetical protein